MQTTLLLIAPFASHPEENVLQTQSHQFSGFVHMEEEKFLDNDENVHEDENEETARAVPMMPQKQKPNQNERKRSPVSMMPRKQKSNQNERRKSISELLHKQKSDQNTSKKSPESMMNQKQLPRQNEKKPLCKKGRAIMSKYQEELRGISADEKKVVIELPVDSSKPQLGRYSMSLGSLNSILDSQSSKSSYTGKFEVMKKVHDQIRSCRSPIQYIPKFQISPVRPNKPISPVTNEPTSNLPLFKIQRSTHKQKRGQSALQFPSKSNLNPSK